MGSCDVLGSDLIVTNVQADQLVVLRGNGSGGFNVTVISTVFFANGAAVADVDGDGLDDFVATHKNGQIFVGLNDGSGGFSVPDESFPGIATGNGGVRDTVGDFNNDGIKDLAFTEGNPFFPSSGKVVLLLGQPGGGFVQQPKISVGGLPVDIAAGNFDQTRSRLTAPASGQP